MIKQVLITLIIIIAIIITIVKLFDLKTRDNTTVHELDTTGKTDVLETIYKNKIT